MTWHYNWTNQGNSLTDAEKYDNAKECWDLLTGTYGFTEQAAAGVIGNFENEGLLNPAQWQIGSVIGTWNSKKVGLGLGQWTPASKLAIYCGGYTQAAIENGAKQVEFTATNEGQWVQRVGSSGYSDYYKCTGIPYYTSIATFKTSTREPEDLATCWCACWEGCSKDAFVKSYNERRSDARKWYELFSGSAIDGYIISIEINGNGSAFATPSRATQGTLVTITAIPHDIDTFIDWDLITGGIYVDQYLATQVITMGSQPVRLRANFTGNTPEPAPPPIIAPLIPHKMPLWMYPQFRLR